MKNITQYRYNYFAEMYPYDQTTWDGLITACFSHAHAGWVMLWLSSTAYLQHLTFYTSFALNPYPDLIRWLEDIAQDRLPAEFMIYEEGPIKTLRVIRAENNLLDFQVLDNHKEIKNAQIIFRCRVDRRQLVEELVRKLEIFQAEYFHPEEWEHGFDLRQLDLSTIKKYLHT